MSETETPGNHTMTRHAAPAIAIQELVTRLLPVLEDPQSSMTAANSVERLFVAALDEYKRGTGIADDQAKELGIPWGETMSCYYHCSAKVLEAQGHQGLTIPEKAAILERHQKTMESLKRLMEKGRLRELLSFVTLLHELGEIQRETDRVLAKDDDE